MEKQKLNKESFEKELIGNKNLLEELSITEVYQLIQSIVAIEFMRNYDIQKIYSEDDIVQDIMYDLLRDEEHATENIKAIKTNLQYYIKQGFTIKHFINHMFMATKQLILLACNRTKVTRDALNSLSLDAEIENEDSSVHSLYSKISYEDLSELNVDELIEGLPDVTDDRYYIQIEVPTKNGTKIKEKYTYKNLMRLYIYLYDNDMEKSIRDYIFEVETESKARHIKKVLESFKACLLNRNVFEF